MLYVVVVVYYLIIVCIMNFLLIWFELMSKQVIIELSLRCEPKMALVAFEFGWTRPDPILSIDTVWSYLWVCILGRYT